MAGTMTWVGLDVHARSAHAAAVDVMTGELSRMRFGPGVDAPVAWLGSLPGPVWACYEAGRDMGCIARRSLRGSGLM
jgi:transposase